VGKSADYMVTGTWSDKAVIEVKLFSTYFPIRNIRLTLGKIVKNLKKIYTG